MRTEKRRGWLSEKIREEVMRQLNDMGFKDKAFKEQVYERVIIWVAQQRNLNKITSQVIPISGIE